MKNRTKYILCALAGATVMSVIDQIHMTRMLDNLTRPETAIPDNVSEDVDDDYSEEE